MSPHHITATSLNSHDFMAEILIILGHHTPNFAGFMHCSSADKTLLICDMASSDHVFRRLYDFQRGSPL